MVQSRGIAPFRVNGKPDSVTSLDRPAHYPAPMHGERGLGFLRVKNFHHIASRGLQLARIAHLAAGLTVKGSLGGDDLHFFTFAHNTPTGFSLHQGGEDLGFPLDNAITDKTRAQVSQSSVDIDRALLSLAGTGALFLHCPLEPRAVHTEPFG